MLTCSVVALVIVMDAGTGLLFTIMPAATPAIIPTTNRPLATPRPIIIFFEESETSEIDV